MKPQTPARTIPSAAASVGTRRFKAPLSTIQRNDRTRRWFLLPTCKHRVGQTSAADWTTPVTASCKDTTPTVMILPEVKRWLCPLFSMPIRGF